MMPELPEEIIHHVIDPQAELDEKIVRYVRNSLYCHRLYSSVRDIADAVGIKSPSTCHKRLQSLLRRGLISQVGEGLAARYAPPLTHWKIVEVSEVSQCATW